MNYLFEESHRRWVIEAFADYIMDDYPPEQALYEAMESLKEALADGVFDEQPDLFNLEEMVDEL
jgi:hypothetical protein